MSQPTPCSLFIAGFALVLSLFTVAAADLPADHAARMTRGLETFQKTVRPLLLEHCLPCHGGEKTKGELNLVTREGMLQGGVDGVVIVPFKAAESRLLRLVRHDEEPPMPDKKPKLPTASLSALESWINDGAPYDEPLIAGAAAPAKGDVSAADRDWWSFRPLAAVDPPGGSAPSSHPIDRFIAGRAGTNGLSLNPEADRRTLIRRAYLDLLGLPPKPEEVAAFVQDNSGDAWPRLIDRLLASPHYGERWARHWLDVARFAESSGFEHDYDRPGAFHYRDFVIRAVNRDLPFDDFLRWQLAGDELEPDNPQALAATGFLGAGVFPTQITANEVERTRYDALDDMLSTTSAAFLGLSVGCARCHDHKFDPIAARDYYRLLATFTTTVRSVVDLDLDPDATHERVRTWEAERAPLLAALTGHEQFLKPQFDQWLQGGAAITADTGWTLLEPTNRVSRGGATFRPLNDGSLLAEGKNADQDEYTFTATTSLPRITGLRLDALAHPSMKGNGPGRADNANFALSRIRMLVRGGDGAEREVRLAKAEADFEQNQENLSVAASLDDNPQTGWAVDPQFGKDHSAVFTFAEPVDGTSGAILTVKLEFRVNTRHNIGRPRLAVTGEAVPSLKGTLLPGNIASLLRRAGEAGFASQLSTAEHEALFDWWKRRDAGWQAHTADLEKHAASKPDGRTKVFICGEGFPPHRMHTQGADFLEHTHFLRRGNSDLKNGIATPGFLPVLTRASLTEQHWQAPPPKDAKFSGRRSALAAWMTDLEAGAGPLVARVAVNRVWQHHFGQGLVATPNDFGHTGTPPTHPELLEWLAGEFVRTGWQLKPLHKLIMTSATYRQSSAASPAQLAADPANQLLTRHMPRRLEGEAIRDSILNVSGALDARLFGPGTKDERSPRRSIYFTVKRSELVGSMVAFDLPEPLVSQGSRPTTTVAPQALFLLNGPQVREWATTMAQRLIREAANTDSDRIEHAFRLTLGRAPSERELRRGQDFLARQLASYQTEGQSDPAVLALADFCQALFGLNEFAYLP
jgi:mono/diheme cytochrome c family protein